MTELFPLISPTIGHVPESYWGFSCLAGLVVREFASKSSVQRHASLHSKNEELTEGLFCTAFNACLSPFHSWLLLQADRHKDNKNNLYPTSPSVYRSKLWRKPFLWFQKRAIYNMHETAGVPLLINYIFSLRRSCTDLSVTWMTLHSPTTLEAILMFAKSWLNIFPSCVTMELSSGLKTMLSSVSMAAWTDSLFSKWSLDDEDDNKIIKSHQTFRHHQFFWSELCICFASS